MKLRKQYPREYRIWKAMRSRCNAPCLKELSYQKKGIKCCRRWNSFEHFLSDMGPCPDNCSLDRIDNDKNYEPSNCRWANATIQASNRGAFTPLYSYKGETHILKDWSRILNIKYITLHKRIFSMGMSFEAAISYVDPRDELLVWKGNKYTKQQLCEMYNIPIQRFYERRCRGWSLERILTQPIRKGAIHKI